MNRRRFLAVAGGVVTLAGCTTSDDDSSSAETPSPTETATSTETPSPTPTGPPEYQIGEMDEFGGLELAVTSTAVRDIAIAPYPEFAVVEDPDGFQFLVLAVETDEIGSDAFTPTYEPWLDGEPVDYAEHAPSFRGSPPLESTDGSAVPVADGPDVESTGVDGGELIAIPVPTGEYEQISILASDDDRPAEPEALWKLPDEVVADLALEPAYEVHDATLRLDEGTDEFLLDLTVENTGDRDGVYQGLMNLQGGPDLDNVFTFAVPADETVTEPIPVTVISPDHAEESGGDLPEVELSNPSTRRFEIPLTLT